MQAMTPRTGLIPTGSGHFPSVARTRHLRWDDRTGYERCFNAHLSVDYGGVGRCSSPTGKLVAVGIRVHSLRL